MTKSSTPSIPRINRGAILRSIEQGHLKSDLPDFQAGDTVRVETKVVEGTRTRTQAFEGVVIAINGSGHPQELYRPQDFVRRGRGARVSLQHPADQQDHRAGTR